jgi:hypothetical protein
MSLVISIEFYVMLSYILYNVNSRIGHNIQNVNLHLEAILVL